MDIESYKVWRVKAAERLRRLRDEEGVTQAEFAQATDYSQQMVSRYESNRVPKSMYFLAQMARAGYDVLYFLTGRRSKADG